MSLALARAPRRLLPLVFPRHLSSSSSSAPAAGPLSPRGSGIRAQQQWKRRPFASAAATAEPVEQGAEQSPSVFAAATAEPVDHVEKDAGQLGVTVREKIQRAAEFVMDNRTYTRAQIMAAYFPKHPSKKTEHEIRERMLDMLSVGLATIEVTLKLSGSLFMYGGPSRGAYTKNNFGNMCTAVGVFMLARIFRGAWGKDAPRMQAEFNDFLEEKEMCISMELITTILGDHGQRPKNDYAVVIAIAEFGDGKQNFYSTSELIAFCQKWHLPTNHFWLFSTRKSAASFFAACDALSEEGTATPVCKSLNEIADIVVPGSQDHAVVHGEIVEGLVARIVTRESSAQMEEISRDISQSPTDDIEKDLGPTLREICAANRSDKEKQMKAILKSAGASMCPDDSDWFPTTELSAPKSLIPKFLQAKPMDYSTKKLQEMFHFMNDKPVTFRCFWNYHKIDVLSNECLYFKTVIRIRNDSAFEQHQEDMRGNIGLWPLCRGFFVDITMFKEKDKRAAELAKYDSTLLTHTSDSISKSLTGNILAEEDLNLMFKPVLFTYKLRTVLIRDGLTVLLKSGRSAYETYYRREIGSWGISASKQRDLSKMLDEWAAYITMKCGEKGLSPSMYLSEAEPFLENYAKRCPENQALIGAAGNLIQAEDFLAITNVELFQVDDRKMIAKAKDFLVFFVGMEGSGVTTVCKEIMKMPGACGNGLTTHSIFEDGTKGGYWRKVSDDLSNKSTRITFADRHATTEVEWKKIERICRNTKVVPVPVIPDSKGTLCNPFSYEALAVFMFRVLQKLSNEGNLDDVSSSVVYRLLLSYHTYDCKSQRDMETELCEHFGFLIKIPLLKPDRAPLPGGMKATLDEGIRLFRSHHKGHGRVLQCQVRKDPSKGPFAKDWAQWEEKLQLVLFENADYLNSIQVPIEHAVKEVLNQLKKITSGPDAAKLNCGTVLFAAVRLIPADILGLLSKALETQNDSKHIQKLLQNFGEAHVTLAHRSDHGMAAVASYSIYQDQRVTVTFDSLLYNDDMAALGGQISSSNGEVRSRNKWPHATVYTAPDIAAKETNTLPQLVGEGKAKWLRIDPAISVSGVVDLYRFL